MKNEVQEIEVVHLVFDETIYPRAAISEMHVSRLADSLRAGEQVPPILVESHTKRIIDGVHRWKAWRKVYGEESKIPCELISENDEAKLFILCVDRNTAHGLGLNPFERTKCLLRLSELGVTREVALKALRMTFDSAERMEKAKTAFRDLPGGKKEQIPIKGAMYDFRGETLNKRQQAVNKMAGGMRPVYYIEQLIGLLEANLCARAEKRVLDRLEALRDLLTEKLPVRKKKSA